MAFKPVGKVTAEAFWNAIPDEQRQVFARLHNSGSGMVGTGSMHIIRRGASHSLCNVRFIGRADKKAQFTEEPETGDWQTVCENCANAKPDSAQYFQASTEYYNKQKLARPKRPNCKYCKDTELTPYRSMTTDPQTNKAVEVVRFKCPTCNRRFKRKGDEEFLTV